MSLSDIYMLVGFLLASYAIVGNDAIQTLGTFLCSNSKKPWYVLWAFAASILSAVLIYGWYTHGGDVSYGRLSRVPVLTQFEWYHMAPPIALLLLTRIGVPVSTTFMVLSVFTGSALLGKVIVKSLVGYGVAFVAAVAIWAILSKKLEKNFLTSFEGVSSKSKKGWMIFQWSSTGFLWSQWLIQDFANIYVYLPRQLSGMQLAASLVVLLTMLAIIFKNNGGKIQRIVTTKTNTTDIRSATIIDLVYAIILFFFKEINNLPMSTTWVFLGVLAGREFAVTHQLNLKTIRETFSLAKNDLGKAGLGLAVSLSIVFGIKYFTVSDPKLSQATESQSVEHVELVN